MNFTVRCLLFSVLYYFPIEGGRVPQSLAVLVSFESVTRESELPYEATGALGLMAVVFVPHETASTTTPDEFRKTTRSPPFESPSPIELPSETSPDSVGIFQRERVVEVAAITTKRPGASIVPLGITSEAIASSTFQPPMLTAAEVPLNISTHSLMGFVPCAASTA